MISAARAAWYATYEPWRLERELHRKVPGLWSLQPREPLISVYIPTHNRVDLLMERAIPSVLRQTYENWELIVAAHGCTDDTEHRVLSAAIKDVAKYAEVGLRIRLLRVPRTRTYPPTVENHWLAGPVVPANAALKHCRGDWIARLDDDDEWWPDHLSSLLREAQTDNLEFISSAYQTVRDGKTHIVHDDEGSPPIGGTQTWLYRSYLKFMRYNPDCWRKAHNRVNDTDLAQRFRDAGVRIGHLDHITASVMPRPGEATVGLDAYKKDAANKTEWGAF